MNKKDYQKPSIELFCFQQRLSLLQASKDFGVNASRGDGYSNGGDETWSTKERGLPDYLDN